MKKISLPKGRRFEDGAFLSWENKIAIYSPYDESIRDWAWENGIAYKAE